MSLFLGVSKVEKKVANPGTRTARVPLTKERIILGLDPGTRVMGYGIIMIQGRDLKLLQFGVIHLSKLESHELRLKKIFDRVLGLIDEFSPDEVALLLRKSAMDQGKRVVDLAQALVMATDLLK